MAQTVKKNIFATICLVTALLGLLRHAHAVAFEVPEDIFASVTSLNQLSKEFIEVIPAYSASLEQSRRMFLLRRCGSDDQNAIVALANTLVARRLALKDVQSSQVAAATQIHEKLTYLSFSIVEAGQLVDFLRTDPGKKAINMFGIEQSIVLMLENLTNPNTDKTWLWPAGMLLANMRKVGQEGAFLLAIDDVKTGAAAAILKASPNAAIAFDEVTAEALGSINWPLVATKLLALQPLDIQAARQMLSILKFDERWNNALFETKMLWQPAFGAWKTWEEKADAACTVTRAGKCAIPTQKWLAEKIRETSNNVVDFESVQAAGRLDPVLVNCKK